jgi:hypothetical protein
MQSVRTRIGFVLLAGAFGVSMGFAQQAPQALDSQRATELAELMCRQLPNIGDILSNVVVIDAAEPPPPAAQQEPIVTDDVYDALLELGPYSVPCLTDRLVDTRWMPDPRSEPLVGGPLVGDVAYMILAEKGVEDLLPALAHKKPQDLRADDYFLWPSVGDHRKRLQNAVREWLAKHPDCCGKSPALRATAPSQLKSWMSAGELEAARTAFSKIRPGMTPEQVLRITGKPDAIDPGGDSPDHWQTQLLGFGANDHNENLAYIYFIERWADEIARRDPLRDRYVIMFFSAEGKLTRVLSNVAVIAPIFPASEAVWERLMWGKPVNHQKLPNQ